MDQLEQESVPRGKIGIRFLYTIFFLVIFCIVNFLIELITVVQYAILFLTKRPSEPLRSFSNKVSVYAYRLIRYITLVDNRRPFPFTEFPGEMEKPEDQAKFE